MYAMDNECRMRTTYLRHVDDLLSETLLEDVVRILSYGASIVTRSPNAVEKIIFLQSKGLKQVIVERGNRGKIKTEGLHYIL